jgi:hypothetical protein
VKKSGAISAAHIASSEAFNALTAVCGTLSRVVDVDPRGIDSEVRHHFLQNAKLNRNANNAAEVVPSATSQEMYHATSNLPSSTFRKKVFQLKDEFKSHKT